MGIDRDRFVDVSQELICSVCTDVLEDPIELPCRHVFCSDCISKWMEQKKNCPTCRKVVGKKSIKPALPLIKSILSSLKIRCSFAGCKEVREHEKIIHHEARCDFSPVKCSYEGCKVIVPRRELAKHESSCPERIVSCAHDCGMKVKFAELGKHNCLRDLRESMTEELKKATAKVNELENRVADLEKVAQELRSSRKEAVPVRRRSRVPLVRNIERAERLQILFSRNRSRSPLNNRDNPTTSNRRRRSRTRRRSLSISPSPPPPSPPPRNFVVHSFTGSSNIWSSSPSPERIFRRRRIQCSSSSSSTSSSSSSSSSNSSSSDFSRSIIYSSSSSSI